jgi:branched-chain amino acid transport system substrate-binding protein
MKQYCPVSICTAAMLLFAVSGGSGIAQQPKYGPGASDTEIKVGNIMPYSGHASAYGLVGRTEAAYFQKINDEGGINGRKINFISYDDAYSPPKTVEQARKLVESDEVLFLFSPLGTPTNAAIHKYMNAKKVPHLFVASNAAKFGDPKNFPWTMGLQPTYQGEGQIYAKYLLKEKSDAKIAILYQNDDFGKDYLKGLKDGLGERSAMIIAEESYETTEPTIESRISKFRATGADVFICFGTPKFVAQSIKKIGELGRKPLIFVPGVSSSITSVLKPAGLDNAQGTLSATFVKDPDDAAWGNDPAIKNYLAFLEKYLPGANKSDNFHLLGYVMAQAAVQVLRQCGNELTRENIMKQAANLKNIQVEGMLPGIAMNTTPTDFFPIKEMQMMRFSGESWRPFGQVISSRP